jgi:hypothetical protein
MKNHEGLSYESKDFVDGPFRFHGAGEAGVGGLPSRAAPSYIRMKER